MYTCFRRDRTSWHRPKSKKIIPIHWGAFKLAMHAWNEPPIIAAKEANKKGVTLEIPKIGQAISIDSLSHKNEKWYR